MKLLGVQRKSDGEIIMATHFGQAYKLPNGLTMADVDLVTIVVPENENPNAQRLLSPEEVKKIKKRKEEQLKQQKEMEDFAKDNKIGFGDMVFLLTHSTGFRDWYKEQHGGDCTKCNERWASWNFFRFKGPDFVKKLIKEAKEKEATKEGKTSA